MTAALSIKDGDHNLSSLSVGVDIGGHLAMTSLRNQNTTTDDLETEAEKAFQRAAAQQNGTEDDEFDLEFEGAFQNPPPHKVDVKSDGSSKVSTDNQQASNGPSHLPVKTEGLPSSLPSSQG